MIRKDFYLKAVMSLANGIPFTITSNNDDDNLSVSWDAVENKTAPTDAQIDAEVTRLQAEYDAKEYQRKRAAEYPSYADQFDKIFHEGIDAWKAEIQAIKNKYPKVGE